MHDYKHDSSLSGNAVENTKWEPTNQSAMYITMNDRIHSRSLGDSHSRCRISANARLAERPVSPSAS